VSKLKKTMSGFEEENPFADPAVQNAVAGGSKTKQENLEDYNPFANQQTATSGQAVLQTQNVTPQPPAPGEWGQPPSYTEINQQQISSKDFEELKRRQEELERRAQDLERREAELRNNPHNVRQNNWPPLPSFCPVQPCFYQDINVEIPVEFQKIVKYLFYLWMAHASLLFVNMLVGLLFLFGSGDMGTNFGLGLMYLILFTPASYLCWFRPVYKAFRDDSSMYFMVFFFVFFFQFLTSVIYALGFGNMGSSGLILGFRHLGDGGFLTFVAVLMVLTGAGFSAAALADFYMLVKIHRLYRSTGASVAKAQAEFTSGVMKNEAVRQAAAEAARESVRSQFNAATAGANGQQPTGSRF